MQLKLQRSQREGGVVSKSVIFCCGSAWKRDPVSGVIGVE
jgi:hypothetical protein